MSTAPCLIYRSNSFSVSSVISFYGSSNFTLQNYWTLNEVDPKTLTNLNDVDLSKNPTSKSSELVIKENTLTYGLYKFQYQVIATFNKISEISSNIPETFIKIIPTGLAVFAIQNGVSNILIGSLQSFNLQPSVYSIDFDNLIQPSELNFTYYCKTVDLSDPNSINASVGSIDLLTFKNQALIMDRNLSCFGNNSIISFIN